MSNSKRTIKKQFSNMYDDGKNLNVGKNKTTTELLDNISNSELNINSNSNSNEGIQNNIERSRLNKNTNKFLERKETLSVPNLNIPTSPFKMIYIAIIVIILVLLSLLFFYRDIFIKFFNSVFKSDNDTTNSATAAKVDDTSAKVESTSAKVDDTSAKVDDTSAKVDSTSAKVDSTSAKIDDLDKKVDTLINTKTNCSAVSTLNNKLNNISPYKESKLTTDGYCYIGYDNGQRECVEAYAGDVCMSGEIFPSLDICINPKLRP